MTRPNCHRCGGPLDIFVDPETLKPLWCCNNPHGHHEPAQNDKMFASIWNGLSDLERSELSSRIGAELSPAQPIASEAGVCWHGLAFIAMVLVAVAAFAAAAWVQ